MHIICLQENLKQALNAVERIIGRNLTLPILNNLLLMIENNKLKISSTNLEIGINYWVPVKTENKGSITVPAKLINDFVSNLPNKKIELKTKDKELEVRCERFKAVFKGMSADDFPIIPKIKGESLIKIKSAILKEGLEQVVGMASYSDTRPEISGIYMKFEENNIKLAATDSFRLAEKNIEIEKNKKLKGQQMIIPQRTIQELIRILGEKDYEVEIVFSNNQILFDLGHAQIISRLIEGQYPNYQQIIPNITKTQVMLGRLELINNIRVASLFSGKINDVKVFIKPKNSLVEISAKDTDLGENKSQINAEIHGEELEVFFNFRYLLDGLNSIYSDKVTLGFNESATPVLIRPVGDINYSYVIMPIKV